MACGKPILYNPSTTEDHMFSHKSPEEKQYDCSVDKICFLTVSFDECKNKDLKK